MARLLSSTIVIGALTGAVIGGLGGRLAMRILFLTTGDSVKGIKSDDGFTIGRFTLGNTIGLVITCALLGVFAAVLYLLAQPFVSRLGALAPAAMALFYGVIATGVLVNPDNVDFSVLEPAILGLALFGVLFAAFGGVVCVLVNHAALKAPTSRRSWWLVAPPLVVLLFPPLLVLTIVIALLHPTNRTGRVWTVLGVGAWTTMAGMFTLGAAELARDTATLL